jgi:hypothetical protein
MATQRAAGFDTWRITAGVLALAFFAVVRLALLLG